MASRKEREEGRKEKLLKLIFCREIIITRNQVLKYCPSFPVIINQVCLFRFFPSQLLLIIIKRIKQLNAKRHELTDAPQTGQFTTITYYGNSKLPNGINLFLEE